MPLYVFKDVNTDEVFEKTMKIAERDEYLKDNPNIVGVISAPKIVGGVGTNLKVDDGFREVVSKVKETYRVNNIKDY
jgi:hypothetical protein